MTHRNRRRTVMGVALRLGVHVRAPDLWKLPHNYRLIGPYVALIWVAVEKLKIK